MKATLFGVFLALCVFLTGCDKEDYSKNMQGATVRAGVDLTVTATLDEAPKTEVEYLKLKEQIVAGATAVKKLMEDGSLADLPLDEIEDKIEEALRKAGWDNPLIDQVLDTIKNYLKTQHVPVEKLDPYIRHLIVEAMDEAITATTKSKWGWRRPDKKPKVTVGRSITGGTKIKVTVDDGDGEG